MWTTIKTLEIPKRKRVTALALSNDGLWLVVGDGTGAVHLYDLEGKEVYGHSNHHWGIAAVAISDDNAAIVSVAQGQKRARNKSELATWRIETDDVVVRYNRPNQRYRCPRFLNGDYRFAVKYVEIGIYDPVTGGNGALIPEQSNGDVFAVSPDGKRLVFAMKYDSLHVWSLAEEVDCQERELEGHWCADVEHIAFSGDGSLLVTLDNKGGLRICNFETGDLRAEGFVPFYGDVLCCGWMPSLQGWLLVDETSRSWQLGTDGEMHPLSEPLQKGGATSAAICSGSELVATGSRYGKVSVYRAESVAPQAEAQMEASED